VTFAELKSVCDQFRSLLHATTGRELVDPVSVDEPHDPYDELHFVKLVSWCYVFLFEASQPTARYVLSLLRTASPEDHRLVSSTFENVNNLRTVRTHNLLLQNKRDDYKKRQAHIWLIQNGGNPPDWANCCRSLSIEVTMAVERLLRKWGEVTASEDDAASIVRELVIAVDREWPPHTFDRIVEAAAAQIGLSGLDYVKYRESRLERWRGLVGFFETREHAVAAISSAIRVELEQLFGIRGSPGSGLTH
jgi:hypothetical protein